MAAKKARKIPKKSGKKAAKPTRRAAAAPKARAKVRPAARSKRAVAIKARKLAPKPKRRAEAGKASQRRAAAEARRKTARAAKPAPKKAPPAPRKVKAHVEAPKPRREAAAKPVPRPAAAPAQGSRPGRPSAPGAAPGRNARPSAPAGAGSRPGIRSTAPAAAPPAGSRPGSRSDRPSAAPSRRSSEAPPPDRRSSPGATKGKARASAPPAALRDTRPPIREAPRLVSLPLPIMAPPKRPSIEERAGQIDQRLGAAAPDFKKRYEDSLDMSWIYHDSALEGVVYTFEELRNALSGMAPPVTDSSLQPTYDDIRRHKEAIGYVRESGLNKKMPITIDVIKKIYLILHPEEGDIKTVKYRKDIPQHRLYFHEYAPPDKIAYKLRQIVDWLNDPETRKTRNGIRIAARAHYDMLRVFPFASDSGKVARLFMNLLLIRAGLPPSIIHSTERQRYYEALKGSATTVLQMVQEAVENALSSVEKLLDEHETRKRAFVS
jgi:Fic family protein